MKDLFKVMPALAPDYSGVCSVFYEMGGVCVTYDGGGCIGHTLQIDESRWFIDKRTVFTMNLREIETAFGDDEKTVMKLIYALQAVGGKYLVLLGTPVPMMIGCDYKAVARITEKRTGVPCIGINTSGYKFYDEGQSMAYMELIRKFGDCEEKRINEVNVLGATQLDMWDLNSVKELRNILGEVGLEKISFWGADADIEDIAGGKYARFNIVVSNSGLEVAKYLEKTAGVPYITGFPVGNLQKRYYVEKIKNVLCGSGIVTKDEVKKEINRTSYKKTLIVGEYVASESIRRCLEDEYGMTHVDVASYFRMPKDLIRDGDLLLKEEADFERCVMEGGYDLVIGDTMLQKVIPHYTGRYLENPHMGISGTIYLGKAFNYVGEKGTLSFNHYFGLD